MDQKYSLAAAMFGVALMTLGISGQVGSQIGMIAFVFGFVVLVSGLLLTLKQERGVKSNKTKEEKDSPAMIRATGVVVGLASLAAPYFEAPIATNPTETAHSVMEIAIAFVSGMELEINFMAFMMIVLATLLLVGAFVSVFHHSGGYIMLLGGMTAIFMAMASMGSFEAVWEELGYGLYLMLFAAFVIISSSLVDTTHVYDKGSDWAYTTIVR